MKYTKIGEELYIPKDEDPSEYGDFVTQVIGSSRYIHPYKSYSCFSYAVVEGTPTFSKPSICSSCTNCFMCSFAATEEEMHYSSQEEEYAIKNLDFSRTFDVEKFEKENEYQENSVDTPHELTW